MEPKKAEMLERIREMQRYWSLQPNYDYNPFPNVEPYPMDHHRIGETLENYPGEVNEVLRRRRERGQKHEPQ